jgi:hypothetical protein
MEKTLELGCRWCSSPHAAFVEHDNNEHIFCDELCQADFYDVGIKIPGVIRRRLPSKKKQQLDEVAISIVPPIEKTLSTTLNGAERRKLPRLNVSMKRAIEEFMTDSKIYQYEGKTYLSYRTNFGFKQLSSDWLQTTLMFDQTRYDVKIDLTTLVKNGETFIRVAPSDINDISHPMILKASPQREITDIFVQYAV